MRKTFLIQKNLNHKHIVKALQLFINQNTERSYLLMEYCPYPSLTSLLRKRGGRLTESECK
jgi:serine/threonine protein kinase